MGNPENRQGVKTQRINNISFKAKLGSAFERGTLKTKHRTSSQAGLKYMV